MSIPHPSSFQPALTNERLAYISNLLLTELSEIEKVLSSDVDDGYTRGCSVFGRQKNRIKVIALSGKIEWLTLVNGGNDLVFKVGGVPCRFSNDNPENPQKLAVLVANRYQISFFEETENGDPCRFCFVIDKGASENEDARVVFMGFDSKDTLRCQWISDSVRTLHQVAPSIPQPTLIPKPNVGPKKSHTDGANEDSGT